MRQCQGMQVVGYQGRVARLYSHLQRFSVIPEGRILLLRHGIVRPYVLQRQRTVERSVKHLHQCSVSAEAFIIVLVIIVEVAQRGEGYAPCFSFLWIAVQNQQRLLQVADGLFVTCHLTLQNGFIEQRHCPLLPIIIIGEGEVQQRVARYERQVCLVCGACQE